MVPAAVRFRPARPPDAANLMATLAAGQLKPRAALDEPRDPDARCEKRIERRTIGVRHLGEAG
jgi:hypothetical protein